MVRVNMIICVGIGNGVMHNGTAHGSRYELHELLGTLKQYVQ